MTAKHTPGPWFVGLGPDGKPHTPRTIWAGGVARHLSRTTSSLGVPVSLSTSIKKLEDEIEALRADSTLLRQIRSQLVGPTQMEIPTAPPPAVVNTGDALLLKAIETEVRELALDVGLEKDAARDNGVIALVEAVREKLRTTSAVIDHAIDEVLHRIDHANGFLFSEPIEVDVDKLEGANTYRPRMARRIGIIDRATELLIERAPRIANVNDLELLDEMIADKKSLKWDLKAAERAAIARLRGHFTAPPKENPAGSSAGASPQDSGADDVNKVTPPEEQPHAGDAASAGANPPGGSTPHHFVIVEGEGPTRRWLKTFKPRVWSMDLDDAAYFAVKESAEVNCPKGARVMTIRECLPIAKMIETPKKKPKKVTWTEKIGKDGRPRTKKATTDAAPAEAA